MTADAFGHYRLLALLGQGGMGEVWRAQDTRKDREVALKVLGTWLGAEPEYARRFQREAAVAARLNAPNIIPIHDYGEIDGRLYIDMPLIEGSDLDGLLAREGPLPPARAVGIVEQVADALDTAHDAGLLHRDVKPSNVLITTRRGRDFVYLIDFGIAGAAGSATITAAGAMVGTPAYMAPERFEGEGDRRSDVYALACVLYAALTGLCPFVAPTGAHQLAFHLDAHRRLPPPRPSQRALNVPPGFDMVIARGMAKEPAARYATAGELAAAARSALGAARTDPGPWLPGAARPPAVSPRGPWPTPPPVPVLSPPPGWGGGPSYPAAWPMPPTEVGRPRPGRSGLRAGLLAAAGLALVLVVGAGVLLATRGGPVVAPTPTAAPTAAPTSPPAPAPLDVDGTWVGDLVGTTGSLTYRMTAEQAGTRVTGRVRADDPAGTGNYVVFTMAGQVDDQSFAFEETGIEESRPDASAWCLISVSLHRVGDGALAGSWNTTTRNTSPACAGINGNMTLRRGV